MAHMWRSAYKVMEAKLEGERPSGRHRHRWKYNVEKHLGFQHSKLPLHASHVASPPDLNLVVTNFTFCLHVK